MYLPLTSYTSLFFLVESLFMYFVQEEVYSILFLFLFVTSVAYRLFPSAYTRALDKLAIMYVVSYGAWCLWEKQSDHKLQLSSSLLVVVCTFVSVIYLYYGGYWMEQYCFCANQEQAEMWHGLVHMISCFGHNMIVLL